MARTISVVFEIEDKEGSEPIWQAFRENTRILGSKIKAIGNGNAFKDKDNLEGVLNAIFEVVEKDSGSTTANRILDIIDTHDKNADIV